MEIFNALYSFFGFDLLTETATLIDFLNCGLKVGLAVFVTCFFIKSLFSIMGFVSTADIVGRW